MLTSAMSVENATDHVNLWLDQPNTRFVVPGPRHLDIAFGLLKAIGSGANLTTDVQLAAYAIEQEAEQLVDGGNHLGSLDARGSAAVPGQPLLQARAGRDACCLPT